MSEPSYEEMAIRAAKAELERDKWKEQAEMAWRAQQAFLKQDKQALLDNVHLMGIPARDVAHMFEIEATWRREGGTQSMLDWWASHVKAYEAEVAA